MKHEFRLKKRPNKSIDRNKKKNNNAMKKHRSRGKNSSKDGSSNPSSKYNHNEKNNNYDKYLRLTSSDDNILSNNIEIYKKYDTVKYRIEFIKNLLKDNTLKPIIDLECNDTEYYTNPSKYYDINENQSYDTRYLIKKKLHNFYKIINQIGGKLLYIKSGANGHTFKGIVETNDNNNINYAVKVVAFHKKENYGSINHIERPENAEIMMIRLLSYFVINRHTPHIVIPIGTFNTSIKPFISLIKDNVVTETKNNYKKFIENYKKELYNSKVSILISEWANRGDLLDFIRKNHKSFKPLHWKVFFFQIISVLAVIQSKFPTFRHNDFKANNILVHSIKKRKTVFIYTVNTNKYVVPNIGYQIKIWDFDFACIPGMVDNAKVNAKWTNKINVKPVRNRYYDIHFFFNTLIKKGFYPQLMTDKNISKDIRKFINRIIPKKYRDGELITKKGRLLIDHEYVTPEEILKKDPYFKEFREGLTNK